MWPPSWERFIVINSLQHYQVRGGKDQPWMGEMWLAADLGKPRNTVVKSKTWKWKPWSEEMFCTLVVVFHRRRRWHPTPVTLAWKIPRMEEPGRLQSMGSRRVRHDWTTSLSLFTFMHWRRKWQPTPVFLPGESQGWGSLMGCHVRDCTESDTTEAT